MDTSLVRSWRALALRGLAGIVVGISALFWPRIALVTLVLLFGTYVTIDALLTLLAAARPPIGSRWRISLLTAEAFLGIGVGVAALLWPTMTVVVLVILGGVWAVLSGVFEVILGLLLRHSMPFGWILAFAGAVSVMAGALMLLWPHASALVFVMLLGGYALFFGATMLFFALRLREASSSTILFKGGPHHKPT